ncbi:hypothetical protein EDL81_04465 [Ehrlichia ruminantium]|uniref:hypothetical protein n=1 Tax=Ehrlichia ruminantium TaxID=779 RepID=UPI00130E2692|nr:hypothetical protein [Ehrlichia ruminantium]QGR02864.1 hypothetical protein EDL81_04465 [Ehrlichia ruminantium]
MNRCVLLKINQYLIIFFLCIVLPYSSFSKCVVDSQVSGSNFHSVDEVDNFVCDFCENIFRQFKLLNFRMLPFYMHSFFYPKAFLMHPTHGVIPVPKGDELLNADFESMMKKYRENQQDTLLLSKYGVTYYGIHRHNMDSMCIYYEQMGNCIKQCFPIPSLKYPVLEQKDGKLITKFHVKKTVDESISNPVGHKYVDTLEEMDLTKLQSTIGKSVQIVKPNVSDNYEFTISQNSSTGAVSSTAPSQSSSTGVGSSTALNQSSNIQCLSGLEFPGKLYYIKKYDKTIGGHRYFWVRLNKKKLVRHIYDEEAKRYFPCDDMFSYDLDNVNMESLVASIESYGDYYVIRNRDNKRGGSIKRSSCYDSELYFYVSEYSKEIEDDKECIFGKVEYFSDNGKKIKHCVYKYTSDDFQTFGLRKNVSELQNIDGFFVKEKELDGLVEGNLYFQGMCVDQFPKYDYNVQRYANGDVEKQYVHEIGKYDQCNFIKIEAWGGGQAGDIEDNKVYNGTSGHYTLGVLKASAVTGNKKLFIYVGEGGRFPGQYGEDTVVGLCDEGDPTKCDIALVARGCTTGACEKRHSFIDDSIVVHYRSATGMNFPKVVDNFREHNKFIPWGSSYDFRDGTMGLSRKDCVGPVNSWEKNYSKYPGTGGCARIGKSIQQGTDGMVRITCEQWKHDKSDTNKYAYYNGKLCRTKVGQQECVKGVCVYPSCDSQSTKFHKPIVMFGDKDLCKVITVEDNKQQLLKSIESAKSNVNISYINMPYGLNKSNQWCYTQYDTNGPQMIYTQNHDHYLIIEENKDQQLPVLSCYMYKNGTQQDDGLYRCCYGTNDKNICWKISGHNVIKMFDYGSLPQKNRKAFNEGITALLGKSPNTGDRMYIYDDSKKQLCRVGTYTNHQECIKEVNIYVLRSVYDRDSQDECCKDDDKCKNGKYCGPFPIVSKNDVSNTIQQSQNEKMLSCYMDQEDHSLYNCCNDVKQNGPDSTCWKVLGSDMLEMFDYNNIVKKISGNGLSTGTLLGGGNMGYAGSEGALVLSFSSSWVSSKKQELRYAYDVEKNTFCLDIADDIKNKGCLKSISVCAQSNSTVDKYNSYKLSSISVSEDVSKLNVPSNNVGGWTGNTCDFAGDITQKIKGLEIPKDTKKNAGIRVSCRVKDGKCCYSNQGDNSFKFELTSDNSTNSEHEMCVTDENISLLCYGAKQPLKPQWSKDHYTYRCCYIDLQNTSNNQHVCWSVAEEDLWRILGFYNMSPENRKKLKDEDKKNREKDLVVKKNVADNGKSPG